MAVRTYSSPPPTGLEPLSKLRTRHLVQGHPLPRAVESLLRQDSRAGAAQLLRAVEKRRRANRAEGQRLRRMTEFETPLWQSGLGLIAGVDEAGMSPLAGPVVAGAVVLSPGARIVGVDDSKRLSRVERERLVEVIKQEALGFGVGRVEPGEIDDINIYHAGLLAMRRAVEALPKRPEHLLVDARTVPGIEVAQTPIIKGDQKSLSIAAASILAKTSRDAEMVALDEQYPGYGLAQHKGYPVQAHFAALKMLGASPIHRRSFAPVKAVL